jgi:YYY domain-containing protein
LVGSVVIGSLLATNTWDYPTYLAVGLAGLTLGMGFSTRRILGLAWRTVLLAAISYLLFLPYMRNYVPAVSGLEIFRGDRVPLSTYVLLVGQFLFPLVTLLAIDAWRLVRPEWTARGQSWRLAVVLGAGGMLLAGLAMSLLGIPVGAVTLVVGAAAVSLALTSTLSVERRMVWLLLAAAMGLCLAVEIVSVGGDRMNTVFKFYYQVWTFLAIGAAVALVWLVPHTDRWPIEWHQLWWAMIGILVLATALFPVLSLPAKMRDRFSDLTGPTLDGMAYIAYSVTGDTKGTVDVRPDYEALVWLQENVEGSPVILEGLGEREYLWGNRVSVYTGLPAVVGWRWHQVQQRMATVAGEVERRHLDVYTCYATPAEAQAWEIIRRYDVRYIYVGPYERLYYDPQGLAKFDAMVASGGLQVVYDRGGVRIYEVVR